MLSRPGLLCSARSPHDPAHGHPEVVHEGVAQTHDERRQEGAEQQPGRDDDRHVLVVEAPLGISAEEDHRQQADDRRRRGHHDRPQPIAHALEDRLVAGQPRLAQAHDVVEQHDTVVDDDAAEDHQAEDHDDLEFVSHGEEPSEPSEHRERHGAKDRDG
jgi:hypothetical protein